MAYLVLKTTTGTEYRVFYPEDERLIKIMEAEFYFYKMNAILMTPNFVWRTYIGGHYHSQHNDAMTADIALKEALDGDL